MNYFDQAIGVIHTFTSALIAFFTSFPAEPARDAIPLAAINGAIIISSVTIVFITHYDKDHKDSIMAIRNWITTSGFTKNLNKITTALSIGEIAEENNVNLINVLRGIEVKIEQYSQQQFIFNGQHPFASLFIVRGSSNNYLRNTFNSFRGFIFKVVRRLFPRFFIQHFHFYMHVIAVSISSSCIAICLYMSGLSAPKIIYYIIFSFIGSTLLTNLFLLRHYFKKALEQRYDYEKLVSEIEFAHEQVLALKYVYNYELEDDIISLPPAPHKSFCILD